jgi:peptidoglycan-associated lipoprotein
MSRSLVVLAALVVTACAGAQKPPTTEILPASKPEPRATAMEEPAPEAAPVAASFAPVHFAFDSVTLDETARRVLDGYVDALRRDERMQITIEGHADERGTEEYNQALGEKRATTVRKYLRQSGIPEKRLNSVSFGEDRPAVSGSDETAWAKNRRAELVTR